MALQERERKALRWGAVGAGALLVVRFALFPVWDGVERLQELVPLQEAKLVRYRTLVQSVGWEEQAAETLQQERQQMEGGLLRSERAALASAELQDLVRQMMASRGIEMRSSEFLPVQGQRLGYAEVPVAAQFQCRPEQLVNLLGEIATGSRILRLSRLTIQAMPGPEKAISVSMTVVGVMRAEAGAESSN